MSEPSPQKSFRWMDLCVLVLLCLVTYFPSLDGEFIWDDRDLIVDNPYIQSSGLLSEALASDFWSVIEDPSRFRNFYRPMVTLTYYLDYRLWGEDPFGFHVTNLVVHAANSLLLYFLALQLVRSRAASLFAGALFAVHPIHTESVSWISGRTDLLAGLLVLGATYFFVTPDRARPTLRIAASLSLYVLALLAKEVAAALPLALAFHYVWLGRGDVEHDRRYRTQLKALFAATAAYIVFRVLVLGMSLWLPGPVPLWRLLFNLPLLIGWYWLKLFLPISLDAHVSLRWAPLELWPRILAAALAIAVASWGWWRFGQTRPVALFSGAWCFVFLLPVINAGSFTDVLVAERFLYVPSIGFCLLLGSVFLALAEAPRTERVLRLAAPVIVLVGSLLSWQRSHVWIDEVAFFEEMVATSPDYASAHVLLAHAYLRRDEPAKAISEFEQGLLRDPSNCLIKNALSLSYLRLGLQTRNGTTLDTGFEITKRAIEQCEMTDVLYNTLGEYYMRQRNREAALEQFRTALFLNPERTGYYHNVGALLYLDGKKEEARPYLEKFIARAPDGELKRQAEAWLRE